MGLTKKTSGGTPVSLSQCNLVGHSITIDKKQDLSSYSLTFENGRMKVSAQRAFNTGDDTDYILDMDTPYYILLTVGVPVGDRAAIQVGYHGSSNTQTLVCTSTLREKGECRLHSNLGPILRLNGRLNRFVYFTFEDRIYEPQAPSLACPRSRMTCLLRSSQCLVCPS